MSNIVLSASVRQNLLSLQSTADLLATTQNRLATGNKVNTALDNPTNYFTAQSLNNRASDISNLLDGIGNGVQVLQAANTGITSLQSLVDSAKSVANQALQAAVGYSAKSSVSTTIAGATADNLLGTTTAAASSSFDAGAFTSIDVSNTGAAAAGGVINAGSFSSVNVSGTGSSATASAVTAGAFSAINVSSTGSPATYSAVTAGAFSSVNVSGTGSSASTAATYTAGSFGSNLDLSSGSISFTLDVDGTSQSITLDSSAVTTFNSNTSGSLTASSLSAQDVADLVNYQLAGSSGATVPTTPVTVTGGGDLQIASSASAGTGSVVKITGYSATGVTDTTGLANVDNEGSNLVPAASEKFDLTVGGNTTHVDISKAAVDAYNADSANSSALISSASSLSVDDVVKLVNYQVGSTVASNASGALKFTATTSGSGQTVTTSAVTTAGTATGSTGVVSDSDSSGANLVAAASEKFDLTIDSNTTHVDISKAAVDAYNADSANSSALISSASSLSVDDVVKLVNYQVGSTVASNASGALKFSATAGASHTVTTSVVTTAGSATGSTGVVSNSDSSGAAGTSADALNFSVTVDGTAHSVSISAATLATYNGDSANSASLITDTAASLSAADVAKLVNYQVGSTVASVDSTTHNLDFTSAAGSTHSIATSAVTTAGAASNTTGIASHASVAGTPAGTAGALNFSVTVDGTAHSVSLSAAALTTYNADSANSAAQITDTAASLSVDDVAKLINYQVGSTVASNDSGVLKFTSGTGSTHSVAVSAVTTAGTVTGSTGITAHAAATGTDATGGLSGLTLTIGATGGGTATSITFGSSSGQVKSLNDLNNALSANNLLATIDSSGKLSITTTNDAASATIGAIGGSATTTTGSAFNGIAAASAPVQDAAAQLVRSNLVNQYNNILDQITTTAQDASYNGIDLLNGDQLKLTFNETGTSTLKIQGVSFNSQGLGLSKLVAGSDFLDNASANSAIKSLDNASSSLRTEASALGSNLSIVQIRQDFSKNLINVLQTGSSNLTLADTNEEAANSQALSTRQSIAVSALSLANQSQQSVLQLLR